MKQCNNCIHKSVCKEWNKKVIYDKNVNMLSSYMKKGKDCTHFIEKDELDVNGIHVTD